MDLIGDPISNEHKICTHYVVVALQWDLFSMVDIKEQEKVDGCLVITGKKFEDDRGHFQELFNKTKCKSLSHIEWKQVSYSSSKKDVIRGIHCSRYPKLVSCLKGSVWDACVDLRPHSKTFKEHVLVKLSPQNCNQIYIPACCGHAFYGIEEENIVVYLQGDTYNPENEINMNCLDGTVYINWPKRVKGYTISEKDFSALMFKDISIEELVQHHKLSDNYKDCSSSDT